MAKRQTNQERAAALDEHLAELRKLEGAVTDAEGIAWREIRRTVESVIHGTATPETGTDVQIGMSEVRQALAPVRLAEIDRDAFKAALAKRFSGPRTKRVPSATPVKRGRKPKEAKVAA